MLNVGDFDERIFLGEDASAEIGTPAKSGCTPAIGDHVMQNLQNFDEVCVLISPHCFNIVPRLFGEKIRRVGRA